MINIKRIRRLAKKYNAKIRGVTQKNVLHISEKARFGNLLYFYLHCYLDNKKNKHTFILYTNTMKYWLNYFPSHTKFIVYRDEFKLNIDNLDWIDSYYQNFNKDFTQEELNEFIEKFLIVNSSFSDLKTLDKTVINIRRGDFYNENSDTVSSFDQISYVNKVILNYPLLFQSNIEIVSDDINWCIENLKFPDNIITDNLKYNMNSSPYEDFYTICSAKNLILTNSTFSYWGGYVCKYLDDNNMVIAPDFGSQLYKDKIAIQLANNWEIIDVINE